MTAEQAVLHRALFGAVDLEVSAPALVREGLLAPYQELAFLTRPSPAEADYCPRRVPPVRRTPRRAARPLGSPASRSWAGCRPGWWSGAVLRTQASGRRCRGHGSRRTSPRWPTRPSGCTWPGCWTCRRGPGSGSSTGTRPAPRTGWRSSATTPSGACCPARTRADERALGAIRRALPAVGYRLTRAGVRAGESPGRPGAGPVGEQAQGRDRDPGRRIRRARVPAAAPGAVRLRGRRRDGAG
jgi:hypothetical protein